MSGTSYDSFNTCPQCNGGPPKARFVIKMVKFLFTFGAGVYTGIYVSQNYEVPRVDDPPKLVERINEKIREWTDEAKKKNSAEQIIHDVKKTAKKIMDD